MPATSANIGPGFDVLGLALGLHNEFELAEADRVLVTVEGEGAGQLPRDEQNVVVRGARLVYEALGVPFRGLEVRQRNRIPPSRGLGSSASAWLGGLLGADALLGGHLGREKVMSLAVAQEGHPDNLAAALYGGLTVACWDDTARTVVALPVPDDLHFVVLVPDQEASTAVARAALPEAYSRRDAVYNVGRVALFLAAWTRDRRDLLGAAMDDRLHQPYRERALFPWLAQVFAAARGAGALGTALSGAGPSVLALADAGAALAVAAAMREALVAAGLTGRAIALPPDADGALVEMTPADTMARDRH